jgi:hypothetical protein
MLMMLCEDSWYSFMLLYCKHTAVAVCCQQDELGVLFYYCVYVTDIQVVCRVL